MLSTAVTTAPALRATAAPILVCGSAFAPPDVTARSRDDTSKSGRRKMTLCATEMAVLSARKMGSAHAGHSALQSPHASNSPRTNPATASGTNAAKHAMSASATRSTARCARPAP